METRQKPEYRHIGKYIPRKDAVGILTGTAEFTDDRKFEGLLYGLALKSPHARARILSIDISKAQALPGVHVVLTHENVPERCKAWGYGTPTTRPILDPNLNYVGDAVALVAADSLEIAEEALDLIQVEYEKLKPVLTYDEALDPNSPQIYPHIKLHNELPLDVEIFGETFLHHLVRGDVEKAFEESDFVEEGEQEYNSVPSPLSAEAPLMVARCNTDVDYDLYAASQGTFFVKTLCAGRMPGINVNIYNLNVGGSFGNKQVAQYTLSHAMMLATAVRNRWVKVFLNKSEHLLVHDIRLGNRSKFKVGIKDGVIHAVQGEFLLNSGAFNDIHQMQVAVGLGEVQLAMCKCKNWDARGRIVLTNHNPTGIVRGFGGQEMKAALMPTVMKLAEKSKMDPVDLLIKNYCQAGDNYVWRDKSFQTACEIDYAPAIRAGAEKFGWKEKWKGWKVPTRVEGNKAYGVGVSIHGNADNGEDNSEAYVRIDMYGKAYLHSANTEAGMAQRDNCAKMVAEVLNIPFEDVILTPNNTITNPYDFGTAGSRGTLTSGTACTIAAEDARTQLLAAAAADMFISPEELDTKDGFIFQKSDPNNRRPWGAVLHPFGKTITGYGLWKTRYCSPNCIALFTEVEVDTETGVVKLVYLTATSDVGQLMDPKMLEMQWHGCFGAAGTDTAIDEEHILDYKTGRFVTSNMIDYKWRTFNNFPPFDQVILEGQPNVTRFKALGAGEIASSPGPAAIMMAISNAIRKDFVHYPATPSVVLKALGKY